MHVCATGGGVRHDSTLEEVKGGSVPDGTLGHKPGLEGRQADV